MNSAGQTSCFLYHQQPHSKKEYLIILVNIIISLIKKTVL